MRDDKERERAEVARLRDGPAPSATREGVEALRDAFEALDECVDDLEAELGNRYERPGCDVHPAIQPKYDRDMAVVKGARDALWILRARALTQPMSTSAPEVIEPVDLDAIVDIASEGWRVLNGDRPAPGVGIMVGIQAALSYLSREGSTPAPEVGEALEALSVLGGHARYQGTAAALPRRLAELESIIRAALTHSRGGAK